MDPLARLLDGPRAHDAFLLRSILTPPWSLRIEDRAPLTLASVVRGEAWLVPDDEAAVRLRPGDVAVIRGPDPYTVADHPATPPRVVIHPGQRCATPEGEPLSAAMALGLRTWGDRTDDEAGATTLLTGVYEFEGEINGRLSRVLPQRIVLPADDWDSPLLPLLGEELHRDAPGQQALLDRMLDLLLTAVLRARFSRPEAEVPRWYRAQGDPVVGAALRLLHDEPAHPWTVAALAARTGVSRAALARRFSDLVGEPPMTYLTDLRLTLAADLLREPDATVAAVARQVGYGSAFALSAAFKRERGISPQEYRAAALG
jgi:AraC-like DNA-binding protein